MKKTYAFLICLMLVLSGCSQKNAPSPQNLEIGDTFTLTGVVSYSDEPSDIGQEYCSVTINEKKNTITMIFMINAQSGQAIYSSPKTMIQCC